MNNTINVVSDRMNVTFSNVPDYVFELIVSSLAKHMSSLGDPLAADIEAIKRGYAEGDCESPGRSPLVYVVKRI